MSNVETKEELVQLEATGKCTVCGEAVVLARAAYLGKDNNFRPAEIATPGDKIHCAACAKNIKDARPLRCPHCGRDINPIEFRLDTRSGIGVFYHGRANCMKVINCQMLNIQRAPQPRSSIVVPGRPS